MSDPGVAGWLVGIVSPTKEIPVGGVLQLGDPVAMCAVSCLPGDEFHTLGLICFDKIAIAIHMTSQICLNLFLPIYYILLVFTG